MARARRIAAGVLLAAAVAAAPVRPLRADDPPPGPPPGPPSGTGPTLPVPSGPKRVEPEEIPGIRWERDFQEGMRRAAREGRPVFIAVNATEQGEVANQWLHEKGYPSKEWGEASRPFVCF